MTPELGKLAGRRILFLNWRDLCHPEAGGAETYAEQIARRFARAGALVTLFTAKYPNAPPYDWNNEYLVVREGGRFGVYLAAARHLRRNAHQYDAIVDFQNGIPFFSPFWASADAAVVCVIHHVHQAQFNMYFHWPLNRVARLLESRISRVVYRDRPLIAVSPSTRAEMRHQLGMDGYIHVVPNGLEPMPPSTAARSFSPRIAVVTRLVPHKQLHLLVEAVPDLLRQWPDLHVDIAGTGPAHADLLELVSKLGLETAVDLPGRVSEQIKGDLLGQAWLTVAPSLAEGWGLTVLEANAMGRPAVAFDVPGLRDSVRNQVTGWLVPDGQSLSSVLAAALNELVDPERRELIAEQCRQWAARFRWEASAERLARILLSEISRKEQGSPARRRAVHLATVACWPPDNTGETVRLLRKALRITDIITSNAAGIQVILLGCDEFEATQVLRRVPLPPIRLRPATTTEVLCGVAEDDPS